MNTRTKKRDSQESRFFFILQGFLALFDLKIAIKITLYSSQKSAILAQVQHLVQHLFMASTIFV